jgi:hypothetical protein
MRRQFSRLTFESTFAATKTEWVRAAAKVGES